LEVVILGSAPEAHPSFVGESSFMFVYVLKSESHGNRYIGQTDDIVKRLEEHNQGKCRYTSGRRPWKLIYQEQVGSRSEALKRESFLKSGQGRKFLDTFLK
jgi:putative endonuclease